MINALHVLIFSTDPETDRAFLRDVLGYPHVDDGGGWLIFKLPPAEIGVHPSDGNRKSEVYLMCDDLESTVETLKSHGVQLTEPVTTQEYGTETAIRLPGGAEIGLYEPTHKTAYDL